MDLCFFALVIHIGAYWRLKEKFSGIHSEFASAKIYLPSDR